MAIVSQATADMNNPEEHFAWAMRNMPYIGGVGAIAHPSYLAAWSKHLSDCGFVHASVIAKQAVDGQFDIEKLPKQKIKFQEAQRGPHHTYNNGSHWVAVDKPDPEPVGVPNVNNLTLQERHAILQQFEANGMIKQGIINPDMAEEEYK